MGFADLSDVGARSVIQGQRLASNHDGDARGEGVHHGYKSQHLPSRRWHSDIESIARVGGASAANRLGSRVAATPARRLLAAGNWAKLQNTREISRFPNRSDSDEGWQSNAPAQGRGEDLHSTIEGTGLYPFGRSKGDLVDRPFIGAGLRCITRP